MMKVTEVIHAWGNILKGNFPALSLEITRECPLRCPGCYAYDTDHLGGSVTLRQLSDFKGEALIEGVLGVVRRYRPLHLSIVGGDPLVRFRELEVLLPKLSQMGIYVQLVTSAFRPIPIAWAKLSQFHVVVSIDGLQPEHDVRRKPATYDKILKNIQGHAITVHCTITGQMMQREGYLEDFLRFWSPRPEINRVWMSMFTPQVGDELDECLSPSQRQQAIEDLLYLRKIYPKLDMRESVVREFAKPPASPDECIFAQTTLNISADLKTKITPCQFGGTPDCSRCGCIASMGLAALGHYKVGGLISCGTLFRASRKIGKALGKHGSNNVAVSYEGSL